MDKFYPANYFDLRDFEFREVFFEDKPVWETVKNIEKYIDKFFTTQGVKNLGGRFPRAFLEGEHIYVGEGTKIFPGAFVGNNVIIGNNCEIRPGAFIRENVILGDDCIIGNSCEIKNSILLNHAWTSHFNYVGDSIIGNNTNIAASTIFANIRFDFFDENPNPIKIKSGKECFDTGLLKFGGILGDGSQTGCKALINPGTLIGKKCILGGFIGHRGIIADNTKILDCLK
jgi:NDP-sugar pyrophosphorylase family protein